jgi:prepilin-type N-terminal cleavage/methylation domain-containing protein
MVTKKGFTLIEVLVAVAIFSMLITVFAGFLVGAIKSQQKALASQELVDSVSYNLEYVSRALRMAKKDIQGTCLTTAGAKYNYETNNNRDRIRFLNYQDKCQEFFLEGSRLKERKSTDDTAGNFGGALPLTPAALQVLSFRIGPSDSWGQAQKTQPRVTLSLKIERGIQGEEPPLSINIQTTISQRNLNRIY